MGHHELCAHVEYIFKVRHSSGSEWIFARRYQELFEIHGRLSAVFGTADLPAFPPRNAATAGEVVKGLFAGVPAGCEPSVVAERERAFQVYFDALCGREDIVGTALFQAALAVKPPEPVSHLRVRGWLPPEAGDAGVVALVDIRPESPAPENGAGVVEAYHILAYWVQDERESSGAQPILDFREPANGAVATTVRVGDLVPGTQVELEVCAVNSVGRSTPVHIRLQVPPERPGGAPWVVAPPFCGAVAEQPYPDSNMVSTTASSPRQGEIVSLRDLDCQLLEEKRRELERFGEQQEELEGQRSRVSTRSSGDSVSAHIAEQELLRRIQQVEDAELALESEKKELARSRAALAMVQAHVVSMLDDKKPGDVSFHELHDELHEGENSKISEDKNAEDDVWSMDWNATVFGGSERSTSASTHATAFGESERSTSASTHG